MSSTTGAILLLVAGLGSMGYVTYRALSNEDQKAQTVREELKQERPAVHVKIVTHRTERELMDSLLKLGVEYKPEALSTKVALSETLCEVHYLITKRDIRVSQTDFVAEQVSKCQELVVDFTGKTVAY